MVTFKNKFTIASIDFFLTIKDYCILPLEQLVLRDDRLLSYCALFKDIHCGLGIPKKSIILVDFGEIPLVTNVDTAYSRF